MVQQRSICEDFVLSNLQSVAICSALSKNMEYSELKKRIFGGFGDQTEDIVLNHNVRSSYLAAGICVLYAKNDRVCWIYLILGDFLDLFNFEIYTRFI
jgi:hypothetical protein